MNDPLLLIVIAYAVFAATVIVPLVIIVEHILEKRRIRREMLRSIIWRY